MSAGSATAGSEGGADEGGLDETRMVGSLGTGTPTLRVWRNAAEPARVKPCRRCRMPSGPLSELRRTPIQLAMCAALFVAVLDNTILNVALPSLVRELGATTSQLQWILDSYVLVFAGLQITVGALGDRYGRKGALQLGLAILGLGSAFAATVDSAGWLIVARSLMGVGAALISPSSLSILTNVFTAPAERAKAIGIWSATSGVGIALGPTVGGLLLRQFWWGSVFLVNVPLVAITMLIVAKYVPTSRDPQVRKLDPVGAVLSMAAAGTLVYAIVEAPARGWGSTATLANALVGMAVATAFILWELHHPTPILDLRFFRDPRFSAAVGGASVLWFCLSGWLFIMTQHLQFVKGFDPFQAGIRAIPFAATVFVVTTQAAGLNSRFGTKRMGTVGLALVAVAMFSWTRWSVATAYPVLVITYVLLAVGQGLSIAPLTDSVMGSVPRERAGVASATNNTIRQLGQAVGIAVIGSIVSSRYRSGVAAVAEQLPTASARAVRSSLGAALREASQLGASRTEVLATARRAFVDGSHAAMWVAFGVAVVGAISVYVYLPSTASASSFAASPGDATIEPASEAATP